jgi:hypothetical protein
MRTTTRYQKVRSALLAIAVTHLLVCMTGCASINHNANAVVLGGILGAAGGVAGFAATGGSGDGAAAGVAAGALIGGGIGHRIDKLVWRREAERTHAVCPHCQRSIDIGGHSPGTKAHCSECGGRFLVSERSR